MSIADNSDTFMAYEASKKKHTEQYETKLKTEATLHDQIWAQLQMNYLSAGALLSYCKLSLQKYAL